MAKKTLKALDEVFTAPVELPEPKPKAATGVRQKTARHRHSWSADDDAELRVLLRERLPYDEIAKRLKRTTAAIQQRVSKLRTGRAQTKATTPHAVEERRSLRWRGLVIEVDDVKVNAKVSADGRTLELPGVVRITFEK